MKRNISVSCQQSFLCLCRVLIACICLVLLLILVGCGSSGNPGSSSPVQQFSGNTQVTMQLSSSANNKLIGFSANLQEVKLTDQTGKVVTLFTNPSQSNHNFPEFIHVNGGAEPLVTVSVPQQVYTSASVTLNGGTGFTCVTFDPANNDVFGAFLTGSQSATVNLPAPITVTGDALNLDLNLQVSQSNTLPTCVSARNSTTNYGSTAVFNLTPVKLAAQPTSPQNGLLPQVTGEITAINTTSNGLSLTLTNGQVISVSTAETTAYEGVSGFASLTVGTLTNADLVTKLDGSLQATRIAVLDPTAVAETQGPLLLVYSSLPVALMEGRVYTLPLFSGIGMAFSFSNAVFQVFGGYNNLQQLPFSPVFNASNMIPGQEVSVGTTASGPSNWPIAWPASTVTLMPQTINGTVVQVGTSGGFTTYTVRLASYDLFPTLASQGGQITVANTPATVVVYADSNTRMLNSSSIAAGSLLRFKGLVFVDNGTLRMDCAQISDGVAE